MNYEVDGEPRPKSRGVPPPVVCSDLSSSSSSDARVADAERPQRASGVVGSVTVNGCTVARLAKQSQTHCMHMHHQSAQHLPSSEAATAAAAAASTPSAPRRRRQRVRHAHAHTHGALLLRPGCSSTSHRVRLHAHHTHYASCRGVSTSAVCCAESGCCRESALASGIPSGGGGGPLAGNIGGGGGAGTRVKGGGGSGCLGGGGGVAGGGLGACPTSGASSTCGETPRSALQQRARRHRHRPVSRSTHRARSVGVPCSRVRTSRFCVQLAPCAAAAAAVAAAASAKYGACRSRREPKSRGRLVCSRCCGSLCPEEMMYCPLLCTSSESGTTTPHTPRLAFTSRRCVARHVDPAPACPPQQPPTQTTPPSQAAARAAAAAAYCCGPLRTRRHRPGAVPKPSYPSAVTLPTTQYSRRTVLTRTCDPTAAAAAEISAVTTDVDALLAEYERAYAARTRGFLNAGAPSSAPLPPPPSSPPPLSPPPQPPPPPPAQQPSPSTPQQQPLMPLWMTRVPPTSQPSLPPQQRRSTTSQPQTLAPLLSAPQQGMLLSTPGLRAAMGEPYPPPQRPQGSDVILSGLLSELVSQGYSVNINATEGPLDRGPPPQPTPISVSQAQQPQLSLPPPQSPPQAQMQLMQQSMQPTTHHTMLHPFQQSLQPPLQQSMKPPTQQSPQTMPQSAPQTPTMPPPPPPAFRQPSPATPALSATRPSAVSTPAFDSEGTRGAPLSPSLARLMAPRRDPIPPMPFMAQRPPSGTCGRSEEATKSSGWEARSSKEAAAAAVAAAAHRQRDKEREKERERDSSQQPQTQLQVLQQLGSEDDRAFTPLTLASASPPMTPPSLSLSSRGTAVESALQASATLMDLCASGARVLAPRKHSRTKETRSAPVPGCGCRGQDSGEDRVGDGGVRNRGRARSREETARQETPVRCLFERAKVHGDRMSSSVSTQRRRRRNHRRHAVPPRSQEEYEDRVFDDEDPWLVGSLADPSLDTCSTTSSRCTAADDSVVKGVYAVNMRSTADTASAPAASVYARASPALAAGNRDTDQRTREPEGESSADVELRASKSYIVQLIDRALSREMGEGGGGGGTIGGGGISGGGGTGGGDGGGGEGSGGTGGGGDGFKGGIEASKTIRHHTQSGSLKTLFREKEDMSTRGEPVTVSTSLEPSAMDYGSIGCNTVFSSPSPPPPQQQQQQQEEQRQQCHQQETQKHILQQQQQLLMEELQRSTHALQQPIYPPMMQLLQPSSEGLGKTNYLLVPLPGNSSSLWSPTRIAEEPPYMRQLRQLRWDHLKHIQREIQRLEEIERVQNGWPTGEKPSTP